MADFDPRFRDFEAPASRVSNFLAKFTTQVYILGVDLSHWNASVDFQALKKAGYEFVYLKATEGVDYEDPTFQTRWQQALDAGMIVGPYGFLRSNQGGKNQAEFHLRVIEPLRNATDDHILPPAEDFETADGVSVAVRKDCLIRYHNRIKEEIARDPVCYSSPYLWKLLAENMTFDCVGWTAHWTSYAVPSWPSGWPTTKRLFWQFGIYPRYSWVPYVPGVVGDVDVNRFYGTLDDLKSFVGIRELTDHEKNGIMWADYLERHPEFRP